MQSGVSCQPSWRSYLFLLVRPCPPAPDSQGNKNKSTYGGIIAVLMIIPWNGVVQQKCTGLPEKVPLLRISTVRFRQSLLPRPLANKGLRQKRENTDTRHFSPDLAKEQRRFSKAPPLARGANDGATESSSQARAMKPATPLMSPRFAHRHLIMRVADCPDIFAGMGFRLFSVFFFSRFECVFVSHIPSLPRIPAGGS